MKTESEWQSILQRWTTSSLSQHEFCKAEGITYSQFSKKRATIMSRAKGVNVDETQQPAPLKFLPIEVPQVKVEAKSRVVSMIEIKLPHGIILRIPTDAAT